LFDRASELPLGFFERSELQFVSREACLLLNNRLVFRAELLLQSRFHLLQGLDFSLQLLQLAVALPKLLLNRLKLTRLFQAAVLGLLLNPISDVLKFLELLLLELPS